MKRYVITGATGHIGNNLVRYINRKEPDSEIIAIVRKHSDYELKNTVCRQTEGDITDTEFLNGIILSEDIVIHLAGCIDLTDKKTEETYKINYISTQKICDICIEKKVKKFIYAGSVDGIYKESDGMIFEPEDYYPDRIEGNYGKTKAAAMKYVLEKTRENPNFRAVTVLPSAVIGINDFKPSAVGKVILGVLSGKPEFGINGGYNFVDVTDVCEAIHTLSYSDLCGQYILSGTNVSVRELYEMINKIKGFSKKPIIIPTRLVSLFLPFIKVLNKITLKSLSEPHNYSFEKAEKDFGYMPKNIEDTLKNTVLWFEENTLKR